MPRTPVKLYWNTFNTEFGPNFVFSYQRLLKILFCIQQPLKEIAPDKICQNPIRFWRKIGVL